jgi:hypothetical protein
MTHSTSNTEASPRWPDRTPKSTGNAFDWRAQECTITKEFSAYENGKRGGRLRTQVGLARGEAFYITPTEKPFQTYSHAIPSVFKGQAK